MPTSDYTSVAYHPIHDRYYAADLGGPGNPAYAWDASGNLVNTDNPGVDQRGVYYNPNTGLLESVSYAACCSANPVRGIMALDLDAAGDYLGTNTQLLPAPIAALGTNNQTMPSYDPATDQLFASQGDGTVNVVNRTTGAAQPTITLDLGGAGVVVGNLNRDFVGFTGRTGEELAILDHANLQILVFDLTGAYVGASALPAGVTISDTSYNSGYTNGLFFIRDETFGANGGNRSFRIFPLPGVVLLQPDGAAGKDAYIDNSVPDNNYGNSSLLTDSTGGVGHALIEFDLAAIPAGSTVNQASLEIREWANCNSNINALEVYANLDVWDEATVTWNNAPAYGAVPLATSTGEVAGPACEWVKFDVTAQVQGWVDGTSPNDGFRITGPAAGSAIKFSSSSDGLTASERPILRLDLPPPDGFLPVLSDGCGFLIPAGKQSLWMLAILPLLIAGIVLVRRRT